ncbi:condensation domain-containing protein [Novosphingobium sp. Leaf2]|uniref:condensation domain-containing protein n=1 Tax=Novosphingobium sp. Leaf2 TaxID=1735670 RepID=UPI0009EB254E|nr:condensation domain-containing protein [Novosphingobium sp. Leaf2]
MKFYSLTEAQNAIWFAHELCADKSLYNIGEYVEIFGLLDTEKFCASALRTQNSFDIFRLNFALEKGVPQQFFADPRPEIQCHDFSAQPNAESQAKSWMRQDMGRPVQLIGDEPLFAMALLRVDDDRFFFYHRYHHIICDGASLALIFSDMNARYQSVAQDNMSRSWRDVIEDNNEYVSSSRYLIDRNYWLEKLHDAPPAKSLSGEISAFANSPKPIRITQSISRSDIAGLKALATACRASLAQTFTALCAIYFHSLTSESDVVLGLASSGRWRKNTRATPGMMANVLPLRLHAEPQTTLESFIGAVSRSTREAARHMDYRGEQLHNDLRRGAGFNNPLHSCIVNVFSFELSSKFAGLPTAFHNLSVGPVDDCHISFYEGQSKTEAHIDVDGNPDLYDPAILALHAQRIVRLISTVVCCHVTSPISDLPIVPQDERHRLVQDWNRTARAYPRARGVHQLFAEQAPEART